MTAMSIGLQAPVGVGPPEGVVSAPVGSIYTDTAATNGAIRWIKNSGTAATGWRVLYGDTGVRTLTGLVINGWTTTGISIRRINHLVAMQMNSLNPAAATADAFMADLGAGWRATPAAAALGIIPANGTPTVPARLQIGSATTTFAILNRSQGAGQVYTMQHTWMTVDAWPATMPGT